MKKTFVNSLQILLAIIFVVRSGLATELAHRNIRQLCNLSQRIFVGKCVSATESFAPGSGLPAYTEYTFQVTQLIKGNIGGTITFRQLGLRSPRRISEDLAYVGSIPGMPIYQEGKEYALFLIGDSRLGLTSPVGLFQGSFLVIEDEHGNRMFVNGINNVGLFKESSAETMKTRAGLSQAEKALFSMTKGPISYEVFNSLVKKIVNEN